MSMNFFKHFSRRSGKVVNKSEHSAAKLFFNEIKSGAFLKCEKSGKWLPGIVPDETSVFKMVADNDLEGLKMVARNNKHLLGIKDLKGKSLLHLATIHSKTDLLFFLLSSGLDINGTDEEGDSVLHDAVKHDNSAAVFSLLSRGADVTAKNKKHVSPIHLAVDPTRMKALKCLLDNPGVDPNLPGEQGCTPLHYAAWKDFHQCAKLLLEKNACLWRANNIGSFPLHVASQCSSTNVLTVFVEHIEKWDGKKIRELVNKPDKENNTVLHSAVVGGNLKVVETILNTGADMGVKQTDGNTVVHSAASQGNIDLLQLMFKLRPDEKTTSLSDLNNAGYTPLMEAAMLDRVNVVQYLVREGSDINLKSNDGSTALLIAASKKAWKSVSVLLGQGSDPKIKDSQGRNLLHLIILGGGQPCGFDFCIRKDLMIKMLNEMDLLGCTPLHYASENGLIKTIDQLITMGARINAKSNKQQSALHFASRCGRINTCRHLLNNQSSSSIINEADSMGRTALHLAAEEGHDNVVTLLLKQGASIFRDIDGNTPLHLAAKNGYTYTIKALLSIHTYLLDLTNKHKNTSLHLAVAENQPIVVNLLLNLGARLLANDEGFYPLDLGISKKTFDSCVAIVHHPRWRESMSLKSTLYGCPLVGMIEMMPELCQMVLDRCRTPSEHDPKDPQFHYLYDFSFLQAEHEVVRMLKKKGVNIMSLITLNMMVKHNRVECLYHPVCVAYLNNKWVSYGLWVHLTLLMMYGSFLACLNVFVMNFDFENFYSSIEKTSLPSNDTSMDHHKEYMRLMPTSQKVLLYVIVIFAGMNIFKELLQIKFQKWEYFKDSGNLLEWVFYILLLVLSTPFFFNVFCAFQWQSGAIAVFLAWFNLLVHLQRFERFGIYVVMFLEILQTLVTVIMVFMVLIFAFGFSFYISFNGGNFNAFSTPGVSIMTSAVMMLGAIDYQQVWVDGDVKGTLPNKTLNYVFLAFFILIMPILLINLLIGLAVGDIEAVLKNAKFKRIAMQVQLHTQMEEKLPLWLIKIVDKPFLKVYPNPSCSSVFSKMTRASIQITAADFDVSEEMKTSVEHHSYLYKELHQQKLRTKQIMKEMTKQCTLLRLVVSKMEICTEFDGLEEDSQRLNEVVNIESPIGWSSCALKQAVLKQAFVNNGEKKYNS